MTTHMKHEVFTTAAQASPAVATTTLLILGYPIAIWVQGATFLLVLCQLAYLAWKWRRDMRTGKKE